MNYFPNGQEEISLIKFISDFEYLDINDAKYFFTTQKYYRKRITNLVKKKYLKRTKNTLVLGELGIEYAKLFNFKYNKLNRNQKYYSRLLYISNLGAFFNKSETIKFTPSFDIKDKEMFTIKARRFIGILEINGIDYLTYHISEKHDKRYINSVIYDIQKEKKYKNIIILVNDIKRINVNDFSFGMNQVLVLEDNECNRNKLKYLHSINWSEMIKSLYKENIYLAEYNFCDYTNYKDKYVALFYFLDTEKITRIKYFLMENGNKKIDVICSQEIKKELQKEIQNANYIITDMVKYIDKERNIYD